MASLTDRLSGLGGDKWRLHLLARDRNAKGGDIIEMTIGEPDVATPPALVSAAAEAMKAAGPGIPAVAARAICGRLAERYSEKSGRRIDADQILCFPGAQTALYAVFMGLVEAGDDVLVGDPMYAT